MRSLRGTGGVSTLISVLRRIDRASLIAYGGWAMLTLALVGGSFASLNQAERTETRAMLDRTQAGAVAVEQAMLRVFDAVKNLRLLAQARDEALQDGNLHGSILAEARLRAAASQPEMGIQGVSILGSNGAVAWSGGALQPAIAQQPAAPTPAPPPALVDEPSGVNPDTAMAPSLPPAPLPVAQISEDRGGLTIGAPMRDKASGHWTFTVSLPLVGTDGRVRGALLASLDPLALSAIMAKLQTEGGEISIVQRRTDGMLLGLSRNAAASLGEKPAPKDPVFIAASSASSGQLRDTAAGLDRLVGFQAPDGVPIVVSQIYRTKLALSDFYRLRRVMLSVMFALVAGAFTATRVILANYLLRQRLSEQAMRDPLTQLYNRRYFADIMSQRMAQASREGKSAAVLLIDLDGFKQVNDTRGHPVGDALLRQVADRLLACAASNDVVMRLGGDEFALVRFGRQQRRDATSLARYVVTEMGRIFEVDGYHLRVSGSVGVALSQDGGEALGDLLRNADVALYFVKSGGGGAYQVFDPAMEESVRTRRALEIDLREALIRNELEVYFQPLVQLEPRRVCGFEALLRWHHPELGMVTPSRFIPIAEETGLIAEIGEWVLRQACTEAARWPGNVRIAVNLSPVQFERSDIVGIVSAALRQARLDPARLELEITEGIVMREAGDVLQTMRRLQGLGVRLALDDFGTGYASLSYLRSFPFDKVKIDGSFLADLEGDGGTIVRAMLGLCRHLSLDTLVEGVETQSQLDWLRQEGCTEVQGYLFSRALPSDGVADIITRVAQRGLAELSPILAAD